MRLAHLSLTSRLTPYTHGISIQSRLIQRHVDYKALTSRHSLEAREVDGSDKKYNLQQNDSSSNLPPPPEPVLLTLQHQPTYTIGRRELGRIPLSQQHFLASNGRAAFHESPRGGQITFHGPGQLVVYPIISLRNHQLTPRCYIRLLETSVISTISRFGFTGITTENPGVWLEGGERKIASVGVNVRRGVTGHGAAINVEDRMGELAWGFGRIVACGLEGKEVTWLSREMGVDGGGDDWNRRAGDKGEKAKHVNISDVENAFVEEFTKRLGNVEEVYPITEKDVMSIL